MISIWQLGKKTLLICIVMAFAFSLVQTERVEAATTYYYYDVYSEPNGTWLEQIVGEADEYPEEGYHSDDRWYVRGKATNARNPYYDWVDIARGGEAPIGQFHSELVIIEHNQERNELSVYVSGNENYGNISAVLDLDKYDYRVQVRSYKSNELTGISLDYVFDEGNKGMKRSEWVVAPQSSSRTHFIIQRKLSSPIYYYYDKYEVIYGPWSSEQIIQGNEHINHDIEYWTHRDRKKVSWNGSTYVFTDQVAYEMLALDPTNNDTYQGYSSILPIHWYYYAEYTKSRTRTRTIGGMVEEDLTGLPHQYPDDGLHTDGYWYKRKGPVSSATWEKYSLREYWTYIDTGWEHIGATDYARGHLEFSYDPYTNTNSPIGEEVHINNYQYSRVYISVYPGYLTYCIGPIKDYTQDYQCYQKLSKTNIKNQVKYKLIDTVEAPTGTYPDNGIASDGYWYKLAPTEPTLSVNHPAQDEVFGQQGQAIVPEVRVSDGDGDNLQVSYYVNGESTPRDTRVVSNTKTGQVISLAALDPKILPHGSHSLRFVVADDSETIEETVEFSIDGTGPQLNNVSVASTESSITVAGTAVDIPAGLAPKAYRYTIGNHVSAWTEQTDYQRTGLNPNTAYNVKLEVRDAVGNISSRQSEVYTKAEVPELRVGEVGESNVELIFQDNNPIGSAIQIQSGSQYVNASGMLVATPQWVILTGKQITVKGLASNQTYTFKAMARNAQQVETVYSSAVKGTTLAEPPSLTLEEEQQAIEVSWGTVSGATRYDLEVDGVVRNNGTDTSYTHSGLQPDTGHTYRIRVRNAGGIGPWSERYEIDTLPVPPPTPTIMGTTAKQTTMQVIWDAVARAERYEIEVEGNVLDAGTGVSYTVTGLTPVTDYTLRIRAKNAGGASAWSAPLTADTLPYPPETPTELAADIENRKVTLHWNEAERADTYELEVDGLLVDNSVSTTYTHEELEPLSGHTYRVRAVNAGGKSAWSAPLDITTHPDKPVMPSNILATSDENVIHLSWYQVPHAERYELEIDGSRVEVVEDPTFEHTDLQADSLHTYRVRAENITGYSEWSHPVNVMTLPASEASARSLTNMVAIVTNQSIMLSWDTVAPDAQYEIEVDGQLQDLGTDTVYQHGGLEANAFHMYRIRLKQEGEPGAWIGVLSLATLPNPPDAPDRVKAYPAHNTITLTWDRVDNASGYDIEIDGETYDAGNDMSYEHVELEPGTEHTYRIRAKNPTGVTAWSPAITQSTTIPTYTVEIEEGEPIAITLLASHVQDFSERTFTVLYDPAALEIADLYDFTLQADTGSGAIAESGLTAEVGTDRIAFTVKQNIVPGTSWSGEVTTIRFTPLVTGETTVEVSVE